MDTLYADVSYFQPPVDDTYPYRVLCFRVNDGNFRDKNFAQNYRWAVNAVESGKLEFFICYSYWRSDWRTTGQTAIDMIEAQGGPHSKMAMMIDLESGGNPGGDQSDGINRMYWQWTDWLGTTSHSGTRRVIGYANANDFYLMWKTRPDGLAMVGAGYGVNPNLPGQIAHQYTDGVFSRPLHRQELVTAADHRDFDLYHTDKLRIRLGDSLPLTCPPFGACDMNSADGLLASDFAAACGIGVNDMTPDQAQMLADIREQLCGPGSAYNGWPQLNGRTIVDALAEIGQKLGMPGYQPPAK